MLALMDENHLKSLFDNLFKTTIQALSDERNKNTAHVAV